MKTNHSADHSKQLTSASVVCVSSKVLNATETDAACSLILSVA